MIGQSPSGQNSLSPQQQSVLDALLLEAVGNTDLGHAQLYVSKGANVAMSAGQVQANMQRNGNGTQYNREATLLHLQYSRGLNAALSDFLIEQGHDVDARDAHGNTPLMMAAKQGDLNGVKYYLSRGADPMSTNHRGEIALDEARNLTPYYHSYRQQVIDALVGALPATGQAPQAKQASPVVELPQMKPDETALQHRLNKRFNP